VHRGAWRRRHRRRDARRFPGCLPVWLPRRFAGAWLPGGACPVRGVRGGLARSGFPGWRSRFTPRGFACPPGFSHASIGSVFSAFGLSRRSSWGGALLPQATTTTDLGLHTPGGTRYVTARFTDRRFTDTAAGRLRRLRLLLGQASDHWASVSKARMLTATLVRRR